jgi:outer membrane protein insertion porin family
MNPSPAFLLFALIFFSSQGGSTTTPQTSTREPRAHVLQAGEQVRKEEDELAKKAPIAEIDFAGNVIFSTQELASELKGCLKGSAEQPLMYDERLFEYCTRFTVTNYMRSRGYLKAVVKEPQTQETESGLKITLHIEEGSRYRLGRVKIDGANLFSHEQIIEMLELKPGDVADGEGLFTGLHERLKREYGDKGYIQYDYDVEPIFGGFADSEGDAIVDFDITINEGPLFKVHKIEFIGNTTVSDMMLRPELVLKEGEPFSQTLFDESIKRLNALGLFETIDDRHIEFRTNNEEGLLSLKINVKEKEPS